MDSLYVSFPGAIDRELALWLQECKEEAQASNEHVIARAGINIGDHLFMVLPRGRGRCAFVLEDNWFSLQLSNASAGVLPLALVQIRSEYLTAVGPDEALGSPEDQPRRPLRRLLDELPLHLFGMWRNSRSPRA